VLYAPSGETGETVIISNEQPTLGSNSSAVDASFDDGLLTLSYTHQGAQFVDFDIDGQALTIIILDKDSANHWSAPMIAQDAEWGNFFSFGTNET